MEQLIAHFLCTNTIALCEVAFSNLHLLSLLSEKNGHLIFKLEDCKKGRILLRHVKRVMK